MFSVPIQRLNLQRLILFILFSILSYFHIFNFSTFLGRFPYLDLLTILLISENFSMKVLISESSFSVLLIFYSILLFHEWKFLSSRVISLLLSIFYFFHVTFFYFFWFPLCEYICIHLFTALVCFTVVWILKISCTM